MTGREPTPVEIVRPSSGPLVDFVSAAATFALRSWVAMLLLGALFPYAHIRFGQAVLLILLIGSLNPPSFQYWTRAGVKR